eukprot:gnl/MRDRNA2_/MRDRNA2_82003_c0_seq1.p1 gnl/MRDRNA2_/MRDRNA2_82003_c0~~gnl/MRDRNA2_/MRDRNA2_82003_c0_seq1.p1  ORF type:complete len:178 (+),score=46.15 gnl/MRDRNA2_/MRDRNA2_82003_c0_seq1:65-598(+)
MKEVSPISLIGSDTKLLTAKISLTKGAAGWEPSFSVQYQRSLQARTNFNVPGWLQAASSANLMATWEMTDVFDVILGDLGPASAQDGDTPPEGHNASDDPGAEDKCFDCMSMPETEGCLFEKRGDLHFTCKQVAKQSLKEDFQNRCTRMGGQLIKNVLQCGMAAGSRNERTNEATSK